MVCQDEYHSILEQNRSVQREIATKSNAQLFPRLRRYACHVASLIAGGDDYNAACDYILNRFVSLNQSEVKQVLQQT